MKQIFFSTIKCRLLWILCFCATGRQEDKVKPRSYLNQDQLWTINIAISLGTRIVVVPRLGFGPSSYHLVRSQNYNHSDKVIEVLLNLGAKSWRQMLGLGDENLRYVLVSQEITTNPDRPRSRNRRELKLGRSQDKMMSGVRWAVSNRQKIIQSWHL